MANEFLQSITAGKNALDAVKFLMEYTNTIKESQHYGELMRAIGTLNLELSEVQEEVPICGSCYSTKGKSIPMKYINMPGHPFYRCAVCRGVESMPRKNRS